MGCKGKHSDNSCVCDAVEQILAEQEAVEEIVGCSTSCYSNLLNPASAPGRDTIPFILFTKKGDLFKAFGNVGGFKGDMTCFSTIFFRVERLENCCATLSLLRPIDDCGNTHHVCEPCDPDFFALEKTDFCVEVDLDCFCAIQCLSPELVCRTFDKKHSK
ncbi:CotY/CotZ family spore coat protein [Metabacillus fastidiosus]|uniref:CotY/CotZ family spore coat protein n=1 Tax=Metabacillus fastidiosus TaxID=1458 RepID=UPI002E215997|nr:CotY/CotZ family spore coat protein [Metabacillus fastidiosus]